MGVPDAMDADRVHAGDRVSGSAVSWSRARLTLTPNLVARIRVEGRHWIWIGGKTKRGYGRIEIAKREGVRQAKLAHRLVWELLIGDLPEDLHHRCDRKDCVNPADLEPLTKAEHTKEHHPLRTHCSHGHEYTEANTYWRRDKNDRRSRMCKRCVADRIGRYRREGRLGSRASAP